MRQAVEGGDDKKRGYDGDEHLTREEAYVLSSLAGDLKISEVVDVPHVLVSMHMSKAVLGTGD